jgi:hypothetical protein
VSPENGAVETVDSTAVEIPTVPDASALTPPSGAVLAVAPQVDPTDLVARLAAIKQVQETAMEPGVDYGVVPGTSGKPSLFKPGAEKLSVLFQLDVQLVNEEMWGPGEHLTVISRATVFHIPTGARLGYGEGLCTTRERKYGKRRRERSCPECGEETILKSRKEPEWFCWKKRGGCGATFALDDQRVVGQEVGDKENPDLPDTWNTVLKMGSKRARIDAVLATTGASALFTQDVEDSQPPSDQEALADSAPKQSRAESASSQGPSLDGQRAAQIRKGIGALGLDHKQVDLMLKAVGAPGLREENNVGVINAVKALTPDQAEAVEGRLDATSHGQGAEAPQSGADPKSSSAKALPKSDLPEPDWDGLGRGGN